MSIEVTLVVDEEKQKVQYAECDHEFVDVLFSFMTLPLGTIVRLHNKQSEFGCLDKLYQSVEDLEADIYLQTAPCKTMLLAPKSIAATKFESLALNIYDELNLQPRKIYRCQNWECAYKKFPYYSTHKGVKCGCGLLMDQVREWPKTNTIDGVFVGRGIKFLVTDDFHVATMSSVSDVISFMEDHNITNPINCKERKVQINKSQVLHLLKRSLHSKTPLSDVFLENTPNNPITHIATTFVTTKIKTESADASIKQTQSTANESASMTVKVFESSKGLLVEAGNDFVDLAFSFLTFPLGHAISLLGERFSSLSLGCIHHVYESIDGMFAGNNGEIISAQNKEMLLRTKLPPHYGCGNQVLKVDEILPRDYTLTICQTCYEKGSCLHRVPGVPHTELNPKMPEVSAVKGGGFVKKDTKFIITTDMMVKPISVLSTMQLFTDFGLSINSTIERVVCIDETKALSFLEACLTYPTVSFERLLK